MTSHLHALFTVNPFYLVGYYKIHEVITWATMYEKDPMFLHNEAINSSNNK